MNSKEKFYFDVESIKLYGTRKNIFIEPEVLLWVVNEIEELEKEVKYFEEINIKQKDEIEECKKILTDGIDRDKDPNEKLRILCVLAVNGIYWRDKSIKKISEENEEMWNLINDAADKAVEVNNNWITLREIMKIKKENE